METVAFSRTFLSAPQTYLPLHVYCTVAHSHQTQSLKCQLLPGLHILREADWKSFFFPCVQLLTDLLCRSSIRYTCSTLGKWNGRSAVFLFCSFTYFPEGICYLNKIHLAVYRCKSFRLSEHCYVYLTVPVLTILLAIWTDLSVSSFDQGWSGISKKTRVTPDKSGILILSL